MRQRLIQHVPHILIAWVAIGALIPRVSGLRPLYLFNAYVLLPLVILAILPLQLGRGKNYPALRLNSADLAMVMFLAIALASILFTGASRVAMLNNLAELDRVFLVPFSAFWLVRMCGTVETQLQGCVPILAGLCILESVAGALGLLLPSVLPSFWPGFVNEMGGVRITGTVTQPDGFVAVLVFTATFCYYFLAARLGLAARVAGGALLVLGFSAGFASFSRASWLGGAVVLGLLATTYRKRLIIPALTIALAIALISSLTVGEGRPRVNPGTPTATAAVPAQATAIYAKSYALERLGNSHTIGERVVLAAAGARMFLKKPLFGWGFGSYNLYARSFVENTGPFVPSDWARYQAASHNSHISILAELGLLGYACLAFPLAWVVVRSARILWRAKDDRFFVTLWANAVFLALISIAIDLRFLPGTCGLAGLVLGS